MIDVEHGYIPVGYNIVARRRDTYTYSLTVSGTASSKAINIPAFTSITDVRGQVIPHVRAGKRTVSSVEFTTYSSNYDGTYETYSLTSVPKYIGPEESPILVYYRHLSYGNIERDLDGYSYGTPWTWAIGWHEIRWRDVIQDYDAEIFFDTFGVNADSSAIEYYDSVVGRVCLASLPDKTLSHNLYVVSKSVSTETNPTTI